MQKVGSREFKNRLGKYLSAVRRGKTLLITDRGEPVAKVVPPDDEGTAGMTVDDVLRRLELEGKLRLGRRPLGKFRAIPPRRAGKSASQMIIEDRK
jgi:prevent-host-death family protein